ncbi:hypothetical protein SAMN05660776_1928 [Salegentibacter holothuriorum]|uniref:Lipoprotein n=1 Tax=Salegentibacter holothuriorum TaxID=241145 RepID=A0A1T5CHA5_9FLAO|nr:hypothetical protein [Salegentibacter holothuriorum]SKB58701.1 hypothetical protein SAMN05660776_1928 [Salegentibacter holothuriorum]
MKKSLLLILGLTLGLTSCQKDEDNPFLISANQVGPVNRDIKINKLDSLFAEDSLVKEKSGAREFRAVNEIKVYEKGGKPLMILEPLQEFDSTSTIGYIRVLDPRYKTKTGLNTQSTFKDIIEAYNISRIENTLNAAVVFLDEINAYITIDKKELPADLRYDTDSKIRASQIPDDAKIKYFMIYWD